MTGTVAKPSKPSVKFTALDEPIIKKCKWYKKYSHINNKVFKKTENISYTNIDDLKILLKQKQLLNLL